MEWLIDVNPYAYIARLYGLSKEDFVSELVLVGDRKICLTRYNGILHAFADIHDEKTWEWLLSFAEAHPTEKICSFISPEILNRLSKPMLFCEPKMIYDVYLLDNERPRHQPQKLSDNFSFRSLNIVDIPELRVLFAYQDERQPLVSATFNYEDFVRNYNLGMFDGSKLVGIVGLFGKSSQDLEMGRGFTAPHYRGRGIHKILISGLIDKIRAEGDQRRIYSWTSVDNEAAKHVLASSGFRKLGSLCKVELNAEQSKARCRG